MAVVLVQLGNAIRETIPAWMIPLFLGITRLGNVGLILAIFTMDYWFGNRRRGAHAVSIIIGGMAMIVALKAYFAAPRPPPSVNVIPISGYSFPSGHAATATIAYGVLAYDHEVGPTHLRYTAAAVLVGLVALSRVVLGVHFLRDVLAGIAVGLVFLAGTLALTKHNPRYGFGSAMSLGVAALVISRVSHSGAAVFGAAFGGVIAWEGVRHRQGVVSVRGQGILLFGGFPLLVGLGYLSTRPGFPLPVVVGMNAILIVGLLAAPSLARHVD